MEIDIRQERANHSALRCALFAQLEATSLQYACLQETLQQPQHTSVHYLFLDLGEESLVRDGVKVRLQIGVNHVAIPVIQILSDLVQRHMCASSGSESEAAIQKFSFVDRLQHASCCCLYHTVFHCWNTERPLRSVRFGYIYPPDWLRLVGLLPQLLLKHF